MPFLQANSLNKLLLAGGLALLLVIGALKLPEVYDLLFPGELKKKEEEILGHCLWKNTLLLEKAKATLQILGKYQKNGVPQLGENKIPDGMALDKAVLRVKAAEQRRLEEIIIIQNILDSKLKQ